MEAEKEDRASGVSAAEERGEQQPVAAAAAAEEESQKKKNKRKWKEVAPFGNYRNYYGYRIGQDMDEDPRLKVMKKEWFEGKACLDIGCNSGVVTIHIAKKFHCRSILGIDIDSCRIEDAHWNLRKVMNMEKRNCAKSFEKKVEDKPDGPEQVVTSSSLHEETRNISKNLPHESKDLSSIVSFKRENFVESRHPMSERYDTILCLSVTKWVHLNWGDEGLITLFSKVWRLLQPGGVFVLEPQPWRSYKENHLTTETTAMNYKTIEICPEDFQDILLDKIGFRTVEDLTSALSGTKKGFDRPVLAFYK